MDEQLYIFVDKTGHCFEDFRTSHIMTKPLDDIDKIVNRHLDGITDEGEKHYRNIVGAMLQAGRKFSVGDMFAFRDDLTEAGFVWGKDFYVKKI